MISIPLVTNSRTWRASSGRNRTSLLERYLRCAGAGSCRVRVPQHAICRVKTRPWLACGKRNSWHAIVSMVWFYTCECALIPVQSLCTPLHIRRLAVSFLFKPPPGKRIGANSQPFCLNHGPRCVTPCTAPGGRCCHYARSSSRFGYQHQAWWARSSSS